jgi:hypothetical protein
MGIDDLVYYLLAYFDRTVHGCELALIAKKCIDF